MGRNKALLELAGDSVLDHVIRAALAVASSVRLVGNEPDTYRRYALEMVPDRWLDSGALGGIGTALSASRSERTLVLACDIPLVTPSLLRFLVANVSNHDVVVPETTNEGLHPLTAVYSSRCLPFIETCVRERRLRVVSFFDQVRVRRLGEAELRAAGHDPGQLMNLNTPEDYAAAQAALG